MSHKKVTIGIFAGKFERSRRRETGPSRDRRIVRSMLGEDRNIESSRTAT
jgi:hypothetical protein